MQTQQKVIFIYYLHECTSAIIMLEQHNRLMSLKFKKVNQNFLQTAPVSHGTKI